MHGVAAHRRGLHCNGHGDGAVVDHMNEGGGWVYWPILQTSLQGLAKGRSLRRWRGLCGIGQGKRDGERERVGDTKDKTFFKATKMKTPYTIGGLETHLSLHLT